MRRNTEKVDAIRVTLSIDGAVWRAFQDHCLNKLDMYPSQVVTIFMKSTLDSEGVMKIFDHIFEAGLKTGAATEKKG